ncbi:MAG: ATP synthase F1 subunit delta [Gemmatimonadota bacterium]|nr:ATP synthase F1 subunit delta [Gemmatimonadota bacterium]
MSRESVARNYAGALLELAGREDAEEAWLGHLADIAALFRDSDRFRAFLLTPRVSADRKEATLREALGDRFPEPFLRFLLVVIEKRRQGLLPEMEEACRELLNERSGRVHARVTLPFPADEALRARVETELARVLDAAVTVDYRTDEALIGGLVVRVRDRVLDGSVRRKLQVMRRTLLEERSGAATGRRDGPAAEPQRREHGKHGDV